ncbi:amylo-alpha-1,6-glucosidase [Roseofilum sp. Belize Diploria]|uniref:amylo-alpha-1,6-glucosidase n=1 Tax=Roseofilum sp. Belize Diploria TaxID=2821501 RepID=UPI001B2C677B|nr:amylo-alpha-1,6-glucosidase [Roseofilum sp. Belize Diploria]MBP0008451.1 amylo-alpha-1,6-glucosidase [Roseofilum sp. Belize Diploria]
MAIEVGREICGDWAIALSREWLVTNSIGGYASGTIASGLTRRYHGLLVAALKPPLQRTLLLTKLDETVTYSQKSYPLFTNRWVGGKVDGNGDRHLESFRLEGTTPVWTFACGDMLLEKRIWMRQRENTTYIRYDLVRCSAPVDLEIDAIANTRPYNLLQEDLDFPIHTQRIESGIKLETPGESIPWYLFSSGGELTLLGTWIQGYDLPMERYRGDGYQENHFHACTLTVSLNVGDSLTLVASTQSQVNLDGKEALQQQHRYEQQHLDRWQATPYLNTEKAPDWIRQLILAADQFIVCRPLYPNSHGKTAIAGYPWFTDWGRDTMISLPGLTLATGRTEVAKRVLTTFAQYVDRGMLPNVFPDGGEDPAYNTVDATLWYFEAVRQYYQATRDRPLLAELFPVLADIIDWHCRGTRYQIHRDPDDGLLYAGEAMTQLTWMDAKYGDWVVTPRQGKPVEVNALWYNALHTMVAFARKLGKEDREYETLAKQAEKGFARFWNAEAGYCYDVIDTTTGNDPKLRPNQIFAVSLPQSPLTPEQQRGVVEACGRSLLTSYGLRSLSPDDPQYIGHYGGNLAHRDGAYHQGTVWGWLLGPFAIAHFKVYNEPERALSLLTPMAHHLYTHGIGSISEIFDGDPPFTPRGCIAQAWSVAETLRAWQLIAQHQKV